MTSELQPYPEYKVGPDEQLDRVPADWKITSLGAITLRRSDRNRPDLPLLSVLREKGVVLRSTLAEDENHNFVPDDLTNYRVAHEGDLVINKMKAWQGSVGIAPVDGIVSPAYFVFSLNGISKDYAHRLLRSRAYADYFARASDGVRIGQWDLSIDQMKRIPIVIPQIDEQHEIVRYLDAMDRKIRRFIRNRRRLIEVLNEQKQAIINRAVTRGLNPNVPLKPSGIDWLGNIPVHWKVGRIKTELHNLNTRRIPLSSTERGKMTLRAYDYYGASGVIDKVDDYLFDDELLLIAEDGANLVLRNLPLAIVARGKFWVNNHAHILKPKRGSLEYFAALLECIDYSPWISGAAQPKLTQDRLMAVQIPVPPEDEQHRIAEWIVANTAGLAAAIDKAKREIDLIREYRTRLIADLVTGKLGVRQPGMVVDDKPTRQAANVYFRRSVFAAEIVHRLHNEPTFGHVKCEKLIFLCEKRCGIDTASTYHRKAAGPYDNRALRSIDSQLKKQKWYEVQKRDKRYQYIPLEKAGGHRAYFDRYYNAVAAQFDEIIELCRSWKTQQCEIVATLYAAWEDLLKKGDATDDAIINQVLHHWHPSKQQIDEERWRKALGWMRSKGLTPEAEVSDAAN